MSDRDAFMRTIVENPEDDVPRLVFADWLEENGDADRAAFIRAQCEVARLPEGDPQRKKSETIANRLAKANHSKWVAELPKLLGIKWQNFERGFITDALCGSQTAVARSIEEIFHIAPIQSYVPRSIGGTTAAELQRIPDFARVRSLIIFQPTLPVLRDMGAQELAKLPVLQTLRTLKLPHQGIESEGADALCGVHFPELETINLYASPIGANATVQLFCGEQFPKLSRLELSMPARDELRGLVTAKPSSRLQELFLYEGDFDTAACELLAMTPSLRTIQHLELHGTFVDRGVGHLAESPMFGEVTKLIMGAHTNNTLGTESAAKFRNGSLPRTVRSLRLGFNIGDNAFRELLLKCDWPDLRELELSSGELTDSTLEELCDSPIMERLERLALHYQSFTIQSAKHLVAHSEFTNLKEFLAYNSFTPAANKALKRHFGGRFKYQV